MLAFVLGAGVAAGQGLPSATLTGHVTQAAQALPGVTVTVRSPNLQGTRSATTTSNGDYVFNNMPPGEYTITFELSGFQTVTRTVRLAASQKIDVDAAMSLSGVAAETIAVARADSISTSTQAATTYDSDLLNKLPTARTLLSAVNLTPGVNQNGPRGSTTISGAMSFENLFTVNGVVVTDNIRATPNSLFIEDAIQETTTSTAAISAEYGRFTGGVVNAITKAGGNTFSGSFRTTLNNDAWTAVSPAGETRVQSLIPTYEATLGGPIWKDRIWFFGAGRLSNTTGVRPDGVHESSLRDRERREALRGQAHVDPVSKPRGHGFVHEDQAGRHERQPGLFRSRLRQPDGPEPPAGAPLGELQRRLFRELLGGRPVFAEEIHLRRLGFEVHGPHQGHEHLRHVASGAPGTFANFNSPVFCGVCSPENSGITRTSS